MEELIAIFRNFLIENHCLESYIQNMNNYKPFSAYIEAPRSLIIRAFNWADTKEGHSYWDEIHNKWVNQAPYINKYYYHTEMVKVLETVENDYWED